MPKVVDGRKRGVTKLTKLSDDAVADILTKEGSADFYAKKYGVSSSAIYRVWKGCRHG